MTSKRTEKKGLHERAVSVRSRAECGGGTVVRRVKDVVNDGTRAQEAGC